MDEEETIGENLSNRQEIFCRYYTQNDELFGNATLSYAQAYEIDLDKLPDDDSIHIMTDGSTMSRAEINNLEYNDRRVSVKTIQPSTRKKQYDYCSMAGSRLIRSDKIQAAIRVFLLEMMTDDIIDSVLTKIIVDNKAANKDRVAAIKEYNALRQRIIKKLDLTTMGERVTMTPAQQALIDEAEQKLKDSYDQ